VQFFWESAAPQVMFVGLGVVLPFKTQSSARHSLESAQIFIPWPVTMPLTPVTHVGSEENPAARYKNLCKLSKRWQPASDLSTD